LSSIHGLELTLLVTHPILEQEQHLMGKEKNGSALLIAAKTNKHLLRGMAQCRVIHLKKNKTKQYRMPLL